ncbi:MAG TPA: hypothetical protein VNL35_04975 [Chloroflexota bacterium]|nr:hypothetical protein [Chloroflexota bacterium]
MSVGEYLAHWLEADVRPNVRPSTYSGYERLIRVQLTPRIGAVPLQRLNALHINLAF